MPVNRAYGVDELFEACHGYFDKTGRRISFEYAMIDGVNDADWQGGPLLKKIAHTVTDHAYGEAGFLSGIDGVGVLILPPYQPDVCHAPYVHHFSRSSLPCSMAFRRSWPQLASMSPPRLRRTVAVTPCWSR